MTDYNTMTIEEIIKEAFSRGWNASHECATDFDYDCALNGFLSEVETEVKKFRIAAVSGSLRLVSRNCVNSAWTASWLQKKGLDHCQCGFECKVRVQVERNGHAPYTYIVTKKEYNKLRKELVFQQ